MPMQRGTDPLARAGDGEHWGKSRFRGLSANAEYQARFRSQTVLMVASWILDDSRGESRLSSHPAHFPLF